MNLEQIIRELDLTIFSEPKNYASIYPSGGYASDLLSCVMAGAKAGNIWITIQVHVNILAVAALTEVCAIVISEGATPEPEVIEKANSQGITLLGTKSGTFQMAGKLWEKGIH
jgi:hypothetical protein